MQELKASTLYNIILTNDVTLICEVASNQSPFAVYQLPLVHSYSFHWNIMACTAYYTQSVTYKLVENVVSDLHNNSDPH